MTKQKILLIGGAGFIGSHLAEKLLKLGHEVIIIDKKDKDFSKERVDIVYHLAGAINLRKGINDPGIERAKQVCRFCRENKVKKLIFFSSGGAIYYNPESEYAQANLEIEKIIQLSGLNYIILRLGNVYGPRQWESGIIPQIILNKHLKIKGDGSQIRDFIYINDVVDLAIKVMESDKNGIYNVDAGEEQSINQVIDLVREITGLEIKPAYQGGEDISARALDIEKTKKDFNWEPKVSLKQGLIKTIKWYERK